MAETVTQQDAAEAGSTVQDQTKAKVGEQALWRELAYRRNDGIDVRLLWLKDVEPPQVKVDVADSKTGDEFSVPVRQGENALDVFNHPYAYAANLFLEKA
jgi:hypothetical protein